MSAPRKVVQIATMVVPGMDNLSGPDMALVALCDDGTIWSTGLGGSSWWQQIAPPESEIGIDPYQSAYNLRNALDKMLGAEQAKEVRALVGKYGGRL